MRVNVSNVLPWVVPLSVINVSNVLLHGPRAGVMRGEVNVVNAGLATLCEGKRQ